MVVKLVAFFWLFTSAVHALEDAYILASATSHVVVLPDVHGDSEALLRSLWLAIKHVDGQVAPYPLFAATVRNYMSRGSKSKRGTLKLSLPLSVRSDVAVVPLGDLLVRGPDGTRCIELILAIPKILGWRVLSSIGSPDTIDVGTQTVSNELKDSESTKHNEQRGRTLIVNNFMGFVMIETSRVPSTYQARNPRTLIVHGGFEMDRLRDYLAQIRRRRDLDFNILNQVLQREHQSGQSLRIDTIPELALPFTWGRVLGEGPYALAQQITSSLLKKLRVARIILGHTVRGDHCEGAVILGDERKCLTSCDGRPAIIVMKMNKETEELDSMTAHYTGMVEGEYETSYDLLAREKYNESEQIMKKRKSLQDEPGSDVPPFGWVNATAPLIKDWDPDRLLADSWHWTSELFTNQVMTTHEPDGYEDETTGTYVQLNDSSSEEWPGLMDDEKSMFNPDDERTL
jgi:hypothetical protein